jgi:hypothetical protein
LAENIAELDRKKEEREQYDIDAARWILISMCNSLVVVTGDDRFLAVKDALEKDAD